MRIIIEYCRTRRLDGKLAVVDRVHCDAVSRAAAESIAVVLAASRSVPQTPDIVRVLDESGTEFFRGPLPPRPSAGPSDPSAALFSEITP